MSNPPSSTGGMSKRKKILLFGCALPMGLLVIFVVVVLLVVSSIVSQEFDGEIVELFPEGAMAYAEAPDLESQGGGVLAAWDAFEASVMFQRLQSDPSLGGPLRQAAGEIGRLRTEAPNIEAQAGIDLNADVIGRGCAVGLYRADDATGAAAPSEFLLVTRVGRRLRMGALAAAWAPASVITGNVPGLQLESVAGSGWQVTHPDLEFPIFAAVHRSALIVSNSERLLEGALALAGAGLGGSHLGAAERFAGPIDRSGSGTEPLKLWVDLDAADAWMQWRAKSGLKSQDWFMSTMAEYINAYQDVLLELPIASAVGGWAEVAPDGAMSLRLAVAVDPSRRANPAMPRPEDAAPAAIRLVPQQTAVYSTVRVDFRTLWDRILATSNEEVRGLLRENLSHYEAWLNELFPLLQGSVTGIVGTQPSSAGSPLPPVGAVIACNDPDRAQRMVQRVVDKYRERFAARYQDLSPVEIDEVEIEGRLLVSCRFPNPPKTFEMLGAGFSPSFLFLDGAMVMTTERAFAETIARAAVSREPAIAESPEFRAGLAGEPVRCRAAVHVDGGALGGFLQRFSRTLAEALAPIDWDAINAKLTAQGLKPYSPEWNAAQRAAEQRHQRKLAATQTNLNRLAGHLNHLKSLSIRTTSAPDLPGYRLDARLRLDWRKP